MGSLCKFIYKNTCENHQIRLFKVNKRLCYGVCCCDRKTISLFQPFFTKVIFVYSSDMQCSTNKSIFVMVMVLTFNNLCNVVLLYDMLTIGKMTI